MDAAQPATDCDGQASRRHAAALLCQPTSYHMH